jgi:hypothetical protein
MNADKDKPDAENIGALKALEQFVVENDDLLALESRIARFNIFDALGITRVEIRHSNFLAFILDPAESHGQGQLFLKAVLLDILKSAAPGSRPISPIDLDGIDLRGVEVMREWRNIDLLVTFKEPRFAIAIENKIDSREHWPLSADNQATLFRPACSFRISDAGRRRTFRGIVASLHILRYTPRAQARSRYVSKRYWR